jgi:hypothetical protein
LGEETFAFAWGEGRGAKPKCSFAPAINNMPNKNLLNSMFHNPFSFSFYFLSLKVQLQSFFTLKNNFFFHFFLIIFAPFYFFWLKMGHMYRLFVHLGVYRQELVIGDIPIFLPYILNSLVHVSNYI